MLLFSGKFSNIFVRFDFFPKMNEFSADAGSSNAEIIFRFLEILSAKDCIFVANLNLDF
jgi:hypothetical protein